MCTAPRRLFLLSLLAIALVASQAAYNAVPAHAATLPPGFTETVIASGLAAPTAMAFLPDGRILVAEQGGNLRVVKNGALLATPFLTVATDPMGERGLLGVAVDPNFLSNRFIYIYYTVPGATAHNRVSRFTASTVTDTIVGSEVPIVELDNLGSATNHNGGGIHFGPDGMLYIAVGENANASNAQTLTNRLGKILRVGSDGSIPTDNPFFNTQDVTGVNRQIWAYGLRNPFTFNFQPGTGRLFINDVGAGAWEEVNDGIAGSNYGWPTNEGPINPPNPSFRSPVYAYPHNGGDPVGCAITGGAFYNAPVMPYPSQFAGQYFFADLCTGFIRTLDPVSFVSQPFISGVSQPVDLAVGQDGLLYYLARGGGSNTGILMRVNATASAGATFRGDFNADGRADLAVWRPSNGFWYVRDPFGGTTLSQTQWGLTGDVPLVGDFNADSRADFAVWRPSNGFWYVRDSFSGATLSQMQWGLPGDVPLAADFNADGRADLAVWRPSNGTWYVKDALNGTVLSQTQWGLPGDVPLVADFNADNRADFAVWRPSSGVWYVRDSFSGATLAQTQWGLNGDVPVLPIDFNADGRADFAVWRPSNGFWFVRDSFTGTVISQTQWGLPGDIPVPANFNTDNRSDFNVWRPSSGVWSVKDSFTGAVLYQTQWGLNGDIP